eukprot:41673-Eustigmatos_ZCMA.PRE.1
MLSHLPPRILSHYHTHTSHPGPSALHHSANQPAPHAPRPLAQACKCATDADPHASDDVTHPPPP